jgi:hypothetical protein
MADVRDAIAALHQVANYAGDESARATVADYLNPEPEQDDAADEYAGMTKAELVTELDERGLATSGNKDELVARLRADDARE